jgi:hypothetical protein
MFFSQESSLLLTSILDVASITTSVETNTHEGFGKYDSSIQNERTKPRD